MPENTMRIDRHKPWIRLDRLATQKVTEVLNAMLDSEAGEHVRASRYERSGGRKAYRAPEPRTCPGLAARWRKRTVHRATGGHGQKCTISRSICYQQPFVIL